jgi:hypothetical protein
MRDFSCRSGEFLFQAPVLAYNCTAIPYTLGNAGILINHKRYAEIAELIQLVVEISCVTTGHHHSSDSTLSCFKKNAF